MNQKLKSKLWSVDFVRVLLSALLVIIINQGYSNATPIYVSMLGGINAYSGFLVLDFSIFAALARIFVSGRIDRSRRRSLMIAGAVCVLVGCAFAVILPNLIAQAFIRAIQGVGFGLVTTTTATSAADITPYARLGEGLGYYGLGQSLGMVIGPSLGVVLITCTYEQSPFGPLTFFVASVVLSILLLVAVCSCTYEDHPEKLDPTCAYREELRRRGPEAYDPDSPENIKEERAEGFWKRTFEFSAYPGALTMLIYCLGLAMIVTFVSKFGVESGFSNPGLFFVIAALSMTIIRLLGARLIDALPARLLISVAGVCGIGGLILLALCPNEVAYYISGLLYGLSTGLAYPLFQTVAVRCAPMDRRGAATALYMLGQDIGMGFGGIIGGAVIDGFGYANAFWEGALFIALSLATSLIVFPRKKGQKENKTWQNS